MAMHRRAITGILIGAASILLLAAAVVASSSNFFRIATGTTVGTQFPIGRVVAGAITNPPGSRDCDDGGSCGVPGLIAVANSTLGGLENLQLVGRGMVESGFAQADLAGLAYRGVGPFVATGPLERLRVIANLYPQAIHVVVRRDAGMAAIADLAGKRVSMGLRESGTAFRAEALLELYGVNVDELIREFHEAAQAAERLRDGRLDAMITIDGWPMPMLSDLARAGLVDLLPVDGEGADNFRRTAHGFRQVTIPAGTYKGIDERKSLAVPTLWVASTKIDAELVYGITKALWRDGNRALLDGSHPMGLLIRRETALDDLPIPLHPGARRYYHEQKLIN